MNKEKQNLANYHAELDDVEWALLTILGFATTILAVFVGYLICAL